MKHPRLAALALPLSFTFGVVPGCTETGASPASAGGNGAAGSAGNAGSAGSGAASGAGNSGGAADDAGAAGAGGSDSAGAAGAAPLATLELTGDVTNVHDPDVIEEDGRYYLFSTGQGIQVRTSDDLLSWSAAPQVFATKPSWITTTDAQNPNHLWAPETARFGDTYHLYYSASTFGSQESCIGHATKEQLGSDSPWVDSGKAVLCSDGSDDWNAIDPHPFVDQQGGLWLLFGSFWSGLHATQLDSAGEATGEIVQLATRDNTAVEAPSMTYHDGFYYLFESVDTCCQGADSTYKIMVGRSANVLGPFADKDKIALTEGGGSLLVAGDARWRGPGHSAVLYTRGSYYNVYHAYDAENGGVPTLRIAEMGWQQDGWPVSAGP